MANRWGKSGNGDRFYLPGLQSHCRLWLQPWNWKMFTPWKKNYGKPRQCIQKQRHYFADRGLSSHSYGFSSSHVQMWELDHKESWAPKNWCFQTVGLVKILESPLNSKGIKTAILKEINLEYLLEVLMLKLKLQYFGHQMRRADSLEKTQMLKRLKAGGEGNDIGWDVWMASPTQWTWVWAYLRYGEGQVRLVCCNPWGHKELDNWATEQQQQSHWKHEIK